MAAPPNLCPVYPFTFLKHLMDKIHVQENMEQPLMCPWRRGSGLRALNPSPTAQTQAWALRSALPSAQAPGHTGAPLIPARVSRNH